MTQGHHPWGQPSEGERPDQQAPWGNPGQHHHHSSGAPSHGEQPGPYDGGHHWPPTAQPGGAHQGYGDPMADRPYAAPHQRAPQPDPQGAAAMGQPGQPLHQPGMHQPGMGQPYPGPDQQGMGQPGMGQPYPGPDQQGMGQPGMAPDGSGQPMPAMIPPSEADTHRAGGIIAKQKVTMVTNKYWIHAMDPMGNEGPLLAFAEQKKFKLREEVEFFTDETKQHRIFSFKSRQRIDAKATTDIFDGNGTPIAIFKKDFAKSLLNSTWYLQCQGVDATGRERSQNIAIVRRFGGMLPFVGDLLEMIPWQFHFDFFQPDGTLVLSNERQRKFRDHYKVWLPPVVNGAPLDWRIAGALAVALDAFQGR